MATPRDRSDFLVSAAWLAERLGQKGVVVVDGSWYLPAMGRDGAAEYAAAHIPGAVFFDIDAIADHDTALPHMLPSAEAFGAAVGALGVADDATIVVYDGGGLFSAPRVWWTFRTMGAGDVRILDGGLPAWKAAGYPLESGAVSPPPARFAARLDAGAVRDFAGVRHHLDAGDAVVLDARPADRFRGLAPEPRPAIPPGHMPGSLNLPVSELVADGRLRETGALTRAFAAAGVDLDRDLVTSCGSGVSAAILTLAAEIAGAERTALYDGSWTDWASQSDATVATERPVTR